MHWDFMTEHGPSLSMPSGKHLNFFKSQTWLLCVSMFFSMEDCPCLKLIRHEDSIDNLSFVHTCTIIKRVSCNVIQSLLLLIKVFVNCVLYYQKMEFPALQWFLGTGVCGNLHSCLLHTRALRRCVLLCQLKPTSYSK